MHLHDAGDQRARHQQNDQIMQAQRPTFVGFRLED
jgi:hypothetical protein